MTDRKQHTHNGNCQVCGRPQAVDVVTGKLALHGYKVEFGYFNGTCPGSRELPLQVSRVITDSTIKALRKHAAELVKRIARKELPEKVAKYSPGPGYRQIERDAKWAQIKVPYADADQYEREQGEQVHLSDLDSSRRWALSHANSLQELADRIHGTALIPAIVEKIVKPRAKVDIKTGKVEGTFGSKAERKEHLDRINREYSKVSDTLQALVLAIPYEARTEVQNKLYFSVPLYPHQWNAKKYNAPWIAAFPQAAAIVAEIEKLVAAREAVRAAP